MDEAIHNISYKRKKWAWLTTEETISHYLLRTVSVALSLEQQLSTITSFDIFIESTYLDHLNVSSADTKTWMQNILNTVQQ